MKKEKKHFRSNDELKVRNGLWFKEAPAFWAAFNFPTLPTHCWSCSMCLLYMYLSHIVYQIFISVSFKLNIFQRSLVKMLWITLNHLYSSLRMLIFVLVLMSVNMQISLAACLCFNFIQMMDQMHNFSLMKCCVLTLKPQKCWELMFKAYKESFVRSLHRTCELLKDDFSNKNQKKSCTIFRFFFSMSKFIYF